MAPRGLRLPDHDAARRASPTTCAHYAARGAGRDRRLGAEARRGRRRRGARGARRRAGSSRRPPCPRSRRSCRCRCSAARRIRPSGSRRICASLERLAPFGPSGLVCLTGTADGRDPDDARARSSSTGCGRSPREAERLGLRIGIEPYQRDGGEQWTIVTSIPEAVELIRDAGDPPALGIQFDVWHLWNTPTLFDDIEREIARFVGVHVCDVREPTRGWADRALPGDGRRRRAGDPARARRRRLGRPLRHRDLLRRRHVRRRLPRLVLGRAGRRDAARAQAREPSDQRAVDVP